MEEIDNLILRLRGEMSTRMYDGDVVEILEVLESANEYFEAISETAIINGKLVVQQQQEIEELKRENTSSYHHGYKIGRYDELMEK
ncbi:MULTISPECIES: hypothetical protein [unclassified Cytobacillus]|uniref:hypothetical protein n=1 Tax=unclassified Cytobacillus TaxID=2675268 RepID=UPI0030F4FD84